MKTITIYELLGMVKDGKAPKKIKWGDTKYTLYIDEDTKQKYYQDDKCKYFFLDIKCLDDLNDEVEILEEEKELHANNIEFNINNDKRDCIITLDENDLGIDELHLDNCYFYKENDKWYVKKYDFKNFNLEEKKIPEKFKINYEIDEENTINLKPATMLECDLACRINEIIDYLKSKGK